MRKADSRRSSIERNVPGDIHRHEGDTKRMKQHSSKLVYSTVPEGGTNGERCILPCIDGLLPFFVRSFRRSTP